MSTSAPVVTAYMLKLPADRRGLVSPLTTLVQRLAESAGASSDKAQANVRTQLADYCANSPVDLKTSSTVRDAQGRAAATTAMRLA